MYHKGQHRKSTNKSKKMDKMKYIKKLQKYDDEYNVIKNKNTDEKHQKPAKKFLGEKVEERIYFDQQARKKILKRSYNMCTCCGQKLTEKTMTIEHVIPLSRGGTNDEINLVALCSKCNYEKDNMLFIPGWFYTAIVGKPLHTEIMNHFVDWFQSVKDDFDIEMFPLISPRHNMIINPTGKTISYKNAVPRQLILQWHMTGNAYIPEVESVTGININNLRRHTNKLAEDINHPVSVYTLRKLTTDKMLAVASVYYNKKTEKVVFDIVWSELPYEYYKMAFMSLYNLICDIYYTIGQYKIKHVVMVCDDEKVVNAMASNQRVHDEFYHNGAQGQAMYSGYNEYTEKNEYGIMLINVSKREYYKIDENSKQQEPDSDEILDASSDS